MTANKTPDETRTCRMTRIEEPGAIMYGWLVCEYCGPVYPRTREDIQEWAVRYCPRCGRKAERA